jgi:hypothetical protein
LITRKIHPRKTRTTLDSWCPGSEASAKPEDLERRENETLVIQLLAPFKNEARVCILPPHPQWLLQMCKEVKGKEKKNRRYPPQK